MVVAILLFASSVVMLKASFRYQILSSTASPAIGAISGHRITHYQMDNAASIEGGKICRTPPLPRTTPGCSKVYRKQYLTATLRVSGLLNHRVGIVLLAPPSPTAKVYQSTLWD